MNNTITPTKSSYQLVGFSSPRRCFRVICDDTHGFTFSCPYNQHCLDQYVLGYSLRIADTTDTDFLLCFKMDTTKRTFGFMNKGLFVELVNAHTNIYEKLGHFMFDTQT
jgi:hypothetical protein